MKNLNYRIILRPEPEGGFTVSVPALPGCVTWGATLDEASRMAEDAIQAYLASVAKHGEVIQDDSNTFERQLSVSHA